MSLRLSNLKHWCGGIGPAFVAIGVGNRIRGSTSGTAQRYTYCCTTKGSLASYQPNLNRIAIGFLGREKAQPGSWSDLNAVAGRGVWPVRKSVVRSWHLLACRRSKG